VSRQAEAAGAEVVWAPEMHRSATVTAAAIAAGTSTIGVGTAIALAFTRSPDGHRARGDGPRRDGLGPLRARARAPACSGSTRTGTTPRGASRWRTCARRSRDPRDSSRECTDRRADQVEGEYEHAAGQGLSAPLPSRARRDPDLPRRRRSGDDLKLAGEIAQGWISHELCSRRSCDEQVLPSIDKGLARGGRAPGHRPRRVGLRAVDADGEKARRLAAGVVGFYATVRTYADFFAFHGFAEHQQRGRRRLPRRAGHRAEARGRRSRRHGRHAFTIAGTPDEVAGVLAAYDGVVDAVKLSPPTHGLSPSRSARRSAVARRHRPTSPEGRAPDEAARGHPHHRGRAVRRRALGFGAPRRPRRGGHQDRGPLGAAATSVATCRRTPRARTRCSSRPSTATSAACRWTSTPRRVGGLRGPRPRRADAVYSNLRGDVPAKLGITYDDLKHLNPKIVCVSLSGFGMTGPRVRSPATTTSCRAWPAGWTSPASRTGRRPSPGLSLVDYSGGYVAAISLLAGVHAGAPRRRRHGLRRLALRHRRDAADLPRDLAPQRGLRPR
jgi:alkanesulfonate monooxygenase SsuD/methylene tetrahydromethanopterin reductase-like flavin-dependent oxidoreductase (luciferase family)